MNNLLVMDVAGAPVIVAGVGIVTVAAFFAIIFVIILIGRKIAKQSKKADKAKQNMQDKE